MKQRKAVMDRIERNYRNLINAGLDTGEMARAALDLVRMRSGAEATILSQIVQRMFKSEKILRPW